MTTSEHRLAWEMVIDGYEYRIGISGRAESGGKLYFGDQELAGFKGVSFIDQDSVVMLKRRIGQVDWQPGSRDDYKLFVSRISLILEAFTRYLFLHK